MFLVLFIFTYFFAQFEKTLTTVGDKIYSTIDAVEIFNPQNLTRGMNITFNHYEEFLLTLAGLIKKLQKIVDKFNEQ